MTAAARSRRWSVALVLCACTTVTACSEEPEVAEAPFTPEPTSESAAPTAPGPTTPSPEPTVLTPPDEPAPPLMLTGEDFLAIRRSHEAYREWLYSHPNPDGLDGLYHPDCRCSTQKALLTSYQELGRWWVGPAAVVRSVEVIDQADPDLVTMRVVIDRPEEQRLIDATGTIHQNLPPSTTIEDDIFVRVDSAAPWLLLEFLEVDAPGSS